MEQMFVSLSHAIEGAPWVALAASFVWGILSILLSPCHLSSIPLIVGFISGEGRLSTIRASGLATLFAVGILLTIAAIGLVTALAGRIMGDIGRWPNYLVALLFFAVGLNLLGLLPMPWSAPDQVSLRRKGLVAAFLLGLVFGLALGPCTFAYMAPMLGVSFKAAKISLLYGAALLFAYGVGHCVVIIVAGTSATLVQRYLKWNEDSWGLKFLKGACGVLLMMGGIYLVYAAS